METVTDQVTRLLVGGISPGVLPEGEQAAKLSEARRLCLAGNPFPLVAIQWPELVVDDPTDAQFFDGRIGDPLNPCLRLDKWQRLNLLAFFNDSIREVFIKGCTGAGKGGSTAIGANLLYDVHEEVRIHVTSESFTHACTNMFGEIKAWREKMRFPAEGNVNTSSIAASQRRYVTVLNPRPGKAGESFSGAHGKRTIYIFDEATACETVWFENAAKNAYKIIALANPRTTIGYFRSAFKPLLKDNQDENKTGVCYGVLGRRLCMTVSGLDCVNAKHGRLKSPYAPLGGIEIDGHTYKEGERISEEHYQLVRPLIPNQIDLNQYRSIVHKSKEPWKVRCFAHGMFPDEDPEAQVILSGWLPRHKAAWEAAEKGSGVPVNAFGLDVARSLAGDCSSLAAGSGAGCAAVLSKQLDNYPAIAEWVLGVARDQYGIDLTQGNCPVCIDIGGGYGSGVGDWLTKAGVWVIESVPAGRAQVLPEVYMDIRTEMYALLGRRLSPTDEWANDPWAIPEDAGLEEDLLSAVRKWTPDHTRFRLMPKEMIKEHLGRSPDKGDSVALLFMAVREQDQLNEFFAATSGELIAQAGGAAYEPRSVPTPPTNPRNVSQQIADVVGWMRERNERKG